MKVMISLSSAALDKAKLIYAWVMHDDPKERAKLLKDLSALKIPATCKFAGEAFRQITLPVATYKKAQKAGVLQLKPSLVSSWSAKRSAAEDFWTQNDKGQNVILRADLKKTDNLLSVPEFVASLKLTPEQWLEVADHNKRDLNIFNGRVKPKFGELEIIVTNSERLLSFPIDDTYPVR